MINAIQFIARYIRLLQRHNALIAVHVSSTRDSEYAYICICTKRRIVHFKLRGSYVVLDTVRNYNLKVISTVGNSNINFNSVNNILVSESCPETYKSKVLDHHVKQFGKADKSKIYDAVGATVVAPSDFQSESHQRPK